MQKGDRIRPWKKTVYKAKFEMITMQFELNHHQLWEIVDIKDGICKLTNSTYKMNMTIAETDINKLFDTDKITRGRYYGGCEK